MGFDQNLRLHGTVLAGVMQVANLGVDMSQYWIYQISPIEGSQGCLNKGGGGGLYIYITLLHCILYIYSLKHTQI